MAIDLDDIPVFKEGQGHLLANFRPAYWNRLRSFVGAQATRLTTLTGDVSNHFGNRLAVGESTLPRQLVSANTVATSTGVLRLTYFTATKSEAVTQVRMCSGSTAAAASPTLIRMGLYSVHATTGELTLVASTPNDTTLFAAPGTAYTKAYSSGFSKVAGARYAHGLLVVSGVATPTMAGAGLGLTVSEASLDPRLAGAVGSQTDLPATVTAASLAGSSATSVMYAALLP